MSLDQGTGFVKPQSLTRDAFLGGRLTIVQPASGFRAGLDSVLLGAAIAMGRQRLLDLGSGVGTASLVALANGAAQTAMLAERDSHLAALARENLNGNRFAERGQVIDIDVTAPGQARVAAGIASDHFDAVIANPPFFLSGAGTESAQPARAGARHMAADTLDLWVKAAAAAARPGGEVILVHLASALPELLAAMAGRFGALTVLPVASRPREPASRILVRGIKASRAPLTLLAPFVIHNAAGRAFAPEASAIFEGRARLVW